jgi:TatD DNase family protein
MNFNFRWYVIQKRLNSRCQNIPLQRMLIETDSPYLAPVPFRGKLNQLRRKHGRDCKLLRGISRGGGPRHLSQLYKLLI